MLKLSDLVKFYSSKLSELGESILVGPMLRD